MANELTDKIYVIGRSGVSLGAQELDSGVNIYQKIYNILTGDGKADNKSRSKIQKLIAAQAVQRDNICIYYVSDIEDDTHRTDITRYYSQLGNKASRQSLYVIPKAMANGRLRKLILFRRKKGYHVVKIYNSNNPAQLKLIANLKIDVDYSGILHNPAKNKRDMQFFNRINIVKSQETAYFEIVHRNLINITCCDVTSEVDRDRIIIDGLASDIVWTFFNFRKNNSVLYYDISIEKKYI